MRKWCAILAGILVYSLVTAPRAGAQTIVVSNTTNQNVDNSTSTTEVSIGFRGTVTDVNIRLYGIFHAFPDDLDVTLVHAGRKVRFMSDAGGGDDIAGVHLTFDDQAATYLPNITVLSTGTYRPTDYELDHFVKPKPKLSTFDGAQSKGDWRLILKDDAAADTGGIDGWDLTVKARH